MLLCGKRLIVNGVVVLGSSISLGGYRREEGEETINTSNRCNTMHDMAIRSASGSLTRYYSIPREGEAIRESIPGSGHRSDR